MKESNTSTLKIVAIPQCAIGVAGWLFVASVLPTQAQTWSTPNLGGYMGVGVSSAAATYNAGFSQYVAMLGRSQYAYYASDFSAGLAPGTWMGAQNSTATCYFDIEGGPGAGGGYGSPWCDNGFGMGVVGPDFAGVANGTSGGWGQHGLYAVAQMSPCLLFPPYVEMFRGGTCGQFAGYGYFALPLLPGKATTAGFNVPTGNHWWTLFFNTRNFQGPVATVVPYFWAQFTTNNTAWAGQLLDSCWAGPNKQISSESHTVPGKEYDGPEGTYLRVEPMFVPINNSTNGTIAVNSPIVYSQTALWNAAQQWFTNNGAAPVGPFNSQGAVGQTVSGGSMGWGVWHSPHNLDTGMTMSMGTTLGFYTPDSKTWGYRWGTNQVTFTQFADGTPAVKMPEYYQLQGSVWSPVPPDAVPAAAQLANVSFADSPPVAPLPGSWTAPNDRSWTNYAAGPFQARLDDGNVVTYYWYRFEDQPAIMQAGLTQAERDQLQAEVVKIHSAWTNGGTYLAPPTMGTLADIDPALLVTPPTNLPAVGYVPIATSEAWGGWVTYTWNKATSGNWSVATNWTSASAPAAGGHSYYRLNFTPSGTYVATNDLSSGYGYGGYAVNQMSFSGAVTLSGNPITLTCDVGSLPQINQNSGNGVVINTPLKLDVSTVLGGTGSGLVVISNVISGPWQGLTINSPGTWRFCGLSPNTYSGGTIISRGTLIWGATTNGTSPDCSYALGSGLVTLNSGATLQFEKASPTNALTLNGGTLYAANSAGVTWMGPVALNSTTTVRTDYGMGVSGNVSGAGGLTKTGTNTLTLSGVNSYTGATLVQTGTLACSTSASLAAGSLSISNGATVNLNYSGTCMISSLTLGGVNKPAGVYGSTNSPATYQDAHFSGTGTVTVVVPTKLAFTSVPTNGLAGQPFSVTVQSQDASSSPRIVPSNTTVQLSVNTGAGTLSGATSGTIASGSSSVVISGVIYSASDTMTLTATTTSGMSLAPGTSSPITFATSLVYSSVTSNGNAVVTFTSGSGTWTVPLGVTNVEVLVVGGGGGGGGNSGGGGGGGGVIHSNGFPVSGSATVAVGSGGAGGVSGGAASGSGATSVFASLTAIGGGNGASAGSADDSAGAGGSGGGGCWVGGSGGSGTAGQGSSGGNMSGGGNGYAGAGGGGAGGIGGSVNNSPAGGAGGVGVQYSISGSARGYGGGGGGGADTIRASPKTGGAGGSGSGGKGSDDSTGTAAAAGLANTGGGGGGGANPGAGVNGAAGGSGVVIVSYAVPVPTKLAFASVPVYPAAGRAFSVTVQAQDASGNPQSVTSNTTVQLSKSSGSGTLSGTVTGTISNGTSSVVISGAVYSAADTMTLSATATSGMSLTAAASPAITFIPLTVTGTLGCSGTAVNGNLIITFTNGSGTWTPPAGVTSVEVLVVGGGGGGGGNSGGGGGAGGVIHTNGLSISGAVTVTVGGGGVGGVNSGAAPGNGTNSVFSSLTAVGGGRGASSGSSTYAAGSGGSGGGGFWNSGTGGGGTSGQGNSGGNMIGGSAGYAGAGGGGAGAVGSAANNTVIGAAGGVGVQYSISGSAQWYGGGGGGGADSMRGGQSGGSGGSGGGGSGSGSTLLGTAGAANTGGGGGGGGNPGLNGNGAAGGSGVVIVSFPVMLPSAVAITNTPATAITTTTAALNATLGCSGTNATVYAYWNTVNGGANAALWTNSACVGSWTNVVSTNLGYTATGLLASTAYYFTFRAANTVDTLWATNVQSFTTLAVVPPTPVLPVNGVTITNGAPSFSFTAVAGCMYRLHYKNLLTDADWTYCSWSTNTTGGDLPMTLTDASAAGQSHRFYRLEAAYP